MNDTIVLIQFIALLLFAACLYHAWQVDGRRATQQWFLTGYIFALLLTSLLVVTGQITFDPNMLVIGAAPSLTIMLYPAVFYLAYTIARVFADPEDLRGMCYLMFLLTPALLLPVDATAIGLGWWAFPSESFDFVNGVPFYLPFAWGAVAAGYYFMVGRIRKIHFRGNGQLFAMIIATPLTAGIGFLVIALIQVVVDGLAAVGDEPLLYALLALLYIVLPLALCLNVPRLGKTPPAKR